MTAEDENMNQTCAWLDTLIDWIDRCPRSPIHFAGTGCSFGNRPAPFVELVFLLEGHISDLRMGSQHTAIGTHQVGLLNVHFGNVAPTTDKFRGWCVFLDVGDDHRFKVLGKAPLAMVMSVTDPQAVERSFATLVGRCRSTGWTTPRYAQSNTAKRRADSPAEQALIKAATLELLALLRTEAHPVSQSGPSAMIPSALSDALAAMQRRYHEPDLDRNAIAREAHIHPDHLGRLCVHHLGISPMRYLAGLRIQQAMFLLRHTTERIEPISRQVGFRDAFHFSRVFKSHIGIGPRRYRSDSR